MPDNSLCRDLIQIRAWIEHWQEDVACNLKPTDESLADAKQLVEDCIGKVAALSAENERLRKMLEWHPIETVPLDTIVDLWCTYAGAPASWGNGRPTGEIVHNRHKSKKYGWFGNQSDDGVPNGDGTDLLPVAWRWPTPDVPLELMERYIAARRALEGGEA